MEKEKKPRAKFFVDKDSGLIHAAVIFMALSAVFRLIGCWGLWDDEFYAATQIALPLVCNLLFILCLLLFGKRAFWTTAIPALMGVAFFIIKAFTFTSVLHTVLCILLYLLVAVLYTGTAFGFIRTKWLLVPLFGLPFVYHVYTDILALGSSAQTVTLGEGLRELSVLCIMLSLVFTALAMRKRKNIEELDLPKIKDPTVIVPAPKSSEAEALGDAAPSADAAETAAAETESTDELSAAAASPGSSGGQGAEV